MASDGEQWNYRFGNGSSGFIGCRQEHFNVEINTLLDFEPSENGEEAIVLGIKASHFKYVFTFKELGKEIVEIGQGECCYLSTEVGGAFTGVYLGRESTATAYFDWFDYKPSKDQRILKTRF